MGKKEDNLSEANRERLRKKFDETPAERVLNAYMRGGFVPIVQRDETWKPEFLDTAPLLRTPDPEKLTGFIIERTDVVVPNTQFHGPEVRSELTDKEIAATGARDAVVVQLPTKQKRKAKIAW